MRTLIATISVGLLVVVPATGAEAKTGAVTRAEVFAAAHRIANQSARGLEELTGGAAQVDRSRTSFDNYVRYSNRRQGVSFALFGTNTVNGEARALQCIGDVEVVRTGNGRTHTVAGLTCPRS